MRRGCLIILMMLVLNAFGFAQNGCGLKISEILFNPPRDGYDYVELYNSSQSTIDLQEFMIGNRNVTGDIAALRVISKDPFIIPPMTFVVLTQNAKWLRQYFRVPESALVCQLSSMPSYGDDNGTVVIVNRSDTSICEEVNYSDDWHFSMIDELSGIALERIRLDMDVQNATNWTSASSSSGFGTPGYANSQGAMSAPGLKELELSTNIFSPDNDGRDDFVRIDIHMQEPGFVVNACIYDARGRQVRYLMKNDVLGSSDFFRWDGLDDDQKAVQAGSYILLTNIFNVDGYVKKFKNVILVAYRRR